MTRSSEPDVLEAWAQSLGAIARQRAAFYKFNGAESLFEELEHVTQCSGLSFVSHDFLFRKEDEETKEAKMSGWGMIKALNHLRRSREFKLPCGQICCSFARGVDEACYSEAYDASERLNLLESTSLWLHSHHGQGGPNPCVHGLPRILLPAVDQHVSYLRDEVEADVILKKLKAFHSGLNRPGILGDQPTRLSEAREWIEIARMLRSERATNAQCIATFKALQNWRELVPTLEVFDLGRVTSHRSLRLAIDLVTKQAGFDQEIPWLRRAMRLIKSVSPDELSSQNLHLWQYSKIKLELPVADREAALLELALNGFPPAARAVFQDGVSKLPPGDALTIIDLVLANGLPFEKVKAARALRDIARTDLVTHPRETQETILGHLADVEERVFAFNATSAGSGDRHAMLDLASSFEMGLGAPAVGGNILEAAWKQSHFWRSRVLYAPIGNEAPSRQHEREPRDEIDRSAQIALAHQFATGRGCTKSNEKAEALLRKASLGESPLAFEAATSLAVRLLKRANIAPNVARILDVGGVVHDALSHLEKALVGRNASAAFALGSLLAQPWGAGWIRQFKLEACSKLNTPVEAYRRSWQLDAADMTGDAAKALLARHILFGDEKSLMSGAEIATIAAAIAKKGERSALTLFANSMESLYEIKNLRRSVNYSADFLNWVNSSSRVRYSQQRTLAWSSDYLAQFMDRGGSIAAPAHLRFLQLHLELADLERRVDAPLWDAIVCRATTRAHGATIAPLLSLTTIQDLEQSADQTTLTPAHGPRDDQKGDRGLTRP